MVTPLVGVKELIAVFLDQVSYILQFHSVFWSCVYASSKELFLLWHV